MDERSRESGRKIGRKLEESEKEVGTKLGERSGKSWKVRRNLGVRSGEKL